MSASFHDVVRRVGEVPGVAAVLACEQVDSTNDALRRRADAGAIPAGTVLLADTQTAGRGRLGRHWHSPRGLGLYLSWLVRPRGDVAWFPRWTLLGAVAAGAACRDVAGAVVRLKWPNDVVARGRKLGGVLADLRTSAGGPELILGIGLNVEHREDDLPPELRSRATSLSILSGTIMDRADLAASVVQGLVTLGDRLERGDWDGLRERWTALAPGATSGRVRVLDRQGDRGAWTGTAAGLDERGALRVRRDRDGREVAVLDGESVVPLVER